MALLVVDYFVMRKDLYYGRESLSLKFYDVITDLDLSVKGDIAYYAQGLRPGDTVLDIGCGTGRVSLGLAGMGLQVVGLDLAETMIERARRKLRTLPPMVAARVQFVVADMLDLNLPIRFSRIIIPFYTLNLVSGRARRAEALKVAARHLMPGGQLIVHTNPVDRLQMQKPPESDRTNADIVVEFDDGTRLELVWGDRLIDRERQMTRQQVIYRHRRGDKDLLDESIEDLLFSWISEKEIQVSAQKAGLALLRTDTSFIAGEPGREMIYVLERRT